MCRCSLRSPTRAALRWRRLRGVLAGPIFSVSPNMGVDILNVVFAVVVIGGMGSIGGAVITGLGLGVIEGLTKFAYPPAANIIIFIVMISS